MRRSLLPLLTAFAAASLYAADPASPAASAPESRRLDGYESVKTVENRLSATPLHPIEGIWQYPADGGLVAVERCNASAAEGREYNMVVISVANRALRPGTVLGSLRATSQRDVYDGLFFTSTTADGLRLKAPKGVILTLDDDASRLSMRRIKKGIHLNLWRMLPYIFRFSVSRHDDTPRNLDGWIKIYPQPATPAEPRYL